VSPIVLNVLKLVFIGALYLFLWQVARAMRAHLAAVPEPAAAAPEIALTAPGASAPTVLTITGPLIVGRNPEADLVLEDPFASDFHARIGLHAGNARLQDLDSTNGTYVNDERIAGPVTLRRGDRVRVGETIMEVK
jgi:pSer/pThr/pTyr-binding forkhead associated (FHA) protein